MSALTRIRRERNDSYTTINNAVLRDARLSLKAKGLLMTVMGLPDDWDFSVKGMEAILKEGRDAIYAAIDELIRLGYVIRVTERSPGGKIAGTTYSFRETPVKSGDEPYTGFPDTDNPPQYKKDLIKETRRIDTIVSETTGKSVSDAPISKNGKGTQDPRRTHPAIVAVRDVLRRFPDKDFWDKIIDRFGESPDSEKLLACFLEWKERGYNPNSLKWLNWYFQGIPNFNGRGIEVKTGEPTRLTARQLHALIDAEEASTAAA